MREVGAIAAGGRTRGCGDPQKVCKTSEQQGGPRGTAQAVPGAKHVSERGMTLTSPRSTALLDSPRWPPKAADSPRARFDITTKDENNIPWDLSKPGVQERCMARVKKEKPGLRIGSPMCHDVSQIMNNNWARMSHEGIDRRMGEA